MLGSGNATALTWANASSPRSLYNSPRLKHLVFRMRKRESICCVSPHCHTTERGEGTEKQMAQVLKKLKVIFCLHVRENIQVSKFHGSRVLLEYLHEDISRIFNCFLTIPAVDGHWNVKSLPANQICWVKAAWRQKSEEWETGKKCCEKNPVLLKHSAMAVFYTALAVWRW